MRLFLMIFGWYLVIAGVIVLIRPSLMKRMVDFLVKGSRLVRAIAAAPLFIGAAIFWAAPASRAPLLIQILGVFTMGKGLLWLLIPAPLGIRMIRIWTNLPRVGFLIGGCVALGLGVAVLRSL